MSFSTDIKNELCTLPLENRDALLAELAGMVYTAGSISIGSKGMHLLITTEINAVARRMLAILKKLYQITCTIMVKNAQLRKKDTYIITIDDKQTVSSLLQSIGLSPSLGFSIDNKVFSSMIKSEQQKAGFLRGCFLGGGSINNPKKVYHMEFVVNLQDFLEKLWNILNKSSIHAKRTMRKNMAVIYIKEIEGIITFLTMIGAYSAVLELENIRIYKGIRNTVNRQTNFDHANIDRTVRSALRQTENILLIDREIGLSSLPEKLKETAELRLQYPESSLSDLLQHTESTTRSGINHRLRKIEQIAQKIRDSKEE